MSEAIEVMGNSYNCSDRDNKSRLTHAIDLIVCVDSPGWGGSERDLLRILPYLLDLRKAVHCGKELSEPLQIGLAAQRIETYKHCVRNRLTDALWGIRDALRWIDLFPNARFLVWAHHCESHRWLQVALALRRANFVLVERLLPATEAEARNSRSRKMIKRWVGNRAHRVVLCGYSQVENYSSWFGVKRARLRVVPNGRRVQEIMNRVKELRHDRSGLRRSLGLPEGIIIANVARLSVKQKDQATLIRAFARLRKSGDPVGLLLVGGGDDEAILRQLAAEVAPGSVVFAGEQKDPLPWLAAADLFAFPSRTEGLPGALLEAMAAGLPCVSTDIPGNSELIRHGETGLLVPVGDVGRLADALANSIADPIYAHHMARAALTLVQERYDESVEAEAWKSIFAENSDKATL